MELSGTSIDALCDLITGDIDQERYPYRSGPELINFFSPFGYAESYGSGFPSRARYTEDKLRDLNGSEQMEEVVREALHPQHFLSAEVDVEEAVEYLRSHLEFDGYEIEKVGRYYEPVDASAPEVSVDVDLNQFDGIDQVQVQEQLRKCQRKIGAGDHPGAITNARSLVEAVLIGIEEEVTGETVGYNGDLPSLYRRVYKRLNLDPGGDDLETDLRQILTGLISVVNGLSGIRNRISDAHARSYRTERHHATLAVNAANTFVEFILESYRYQQRHVEQEDQV
jgi:hypothetical protein